MIISASRRTDIPAFYSEWFLNRIRAGYCTVPNPFNRNQISWVSLLPNDVDVIVFWTRNPKPLIPFLDELDNLGYRYYFQYTLMSNPRSIDNKTPAFQTAINTFIELSEKIGPDKIVWRYDPIVFSSITPAEFHQQTFKMIASMLKGFTYRSIISIVDDYKKIKRRMTTLDQKGVEYHPSFSINKEIFNNLIHNITQEAKQNNMELHSCAEEIDLTSLGVLPGKCIDDEYIRETFGIDVTQKKDTSQRKVCGCVVSKDIGAYDTCLFGCQYCYATSSFELAKRQHKEHDPLSPSIIGHYDVENPKISDTDIQLSLWPKDKKN